MKVVSADDILITTMVVESSPFYGYNKNWKKNKKTGKKDA